MGKTANSLEGLHVLLVTEDDARASSLTRALRDKKASVGDVKQAEKDALALRGADLLVVDMRSAESTKARVNELRSDVRARWASVVHLDYARLVLDDGAILLKALEEAVAPVIAIDKELTERARREESFELKLAPLGPSRMLRALAAAGPTMHVDILHETLTASVDLSNELLVCAFAERAGSEKWEAWMALVRILGLLDANIKVSRKSHPSAMNIMEPIDQALEVAAKERHSASAQIAHEERSARERLVKAPPQLPEGKNLVLQAARSSTVGRARLGEEIDLPALANADLPALAGGADLPAVARRGDLPALAAGLPRALGDSKKSRVDRTLMGIPAGVPAPVIPGAKPPPREAPAKLAAAAPERPKAGSKTLLGMPMGQGAGSSLLKPNVQITAPAGGAAVPVVTPANVNGEKAAAAALARNAPAAPIAKTGEPDLLSQLLEPRAPLGTERQSLEKATFGDRPTNQTTPLMTLAHEQPTREFPAASDPPEPEVPTEPPRSAKRVEPAPAAPPVQLGSGAHADTLEMDLPEPPHESDPPTVVAPTPQFDPIALIPTPLQGLEPLAQPPAAASALSAQARGQDIDSNEPELEVQALSESSGSLMAVIEEEVRQSPASEELGSQPFNLNSRRPESEDTVMMFQRPIRKSRIQLLLLLLVLAVLEGVIIVYFERASREADESVQKVAVVPSAARRPPQGNTQPPTAAPQPPTRAQEPAPAASVPTGAPAEENAEVAPPAATAAPGVVVEPAPTAPAPVAPAPSATTPAAAPAPAPATVPPAEVQTAATPSPAAEAKPAVRPTVAPPPPIPTDAAEASAQPRLGAAADDDLAKLIRSGTKQLAERDASGALDTYTRAVAIDAKNPHAQAGMAEALFALGRLDEAAERTLLAIKIRPRRARYRVLLGDILKAKGEPDAANTAWQDALAIDPNDRDAKRRLGI